MKKLKHFISYFIIISILLNLTSNIFCFATANAQNFDTAEVETEEIKDLKSRITDKQKEIDQLANEMIKYKELIKVKEEQASTLLGQISIIENQAQKTQLDIKKIETEIEKTTLEITEKEQEINEAEAKINLQKEWISENVRMLNQNDERSNLELLLMHDKFSDFFNALNSLNSLENELKRVYDDLLDLKNSLQQKKKELEENKKTLDQKKIGLEEQKERLQNQQYSKEVILSQTIATEKEFRNLLFQFQQEQNQTKYQIEKLEDEVKEKLEAEREKRMRQGKTPDDPTKLAWPILNQGISTYFHDPDYPFKKWIGEHSGLDLRTLKNGVPTNGIPVKAAADGVIIKIIREGKLSGNVIYILHDDDIMTVYMHLSRIDVKEDQFVSRGEVIGLSGGMPGTSGAGMISTGPHLHFEVRLKGIPVDPLNYLQ